MPATALSLPNAIKRLTPFAARAPTQPEESDIVRLLERLPPGVSVELVAAVMKRLAKARGLEWLFWAPRAYAPAIAEAMKTLKREPLAVFLHAALPSKLEEWGEQVYELKDAYGAFEYISLRSYRKNRARALARIVGDPRVINGAQATLAVFPDDPHSLLLLLAFEGSESSMDVILPIVTKLLKDPAELDFLRDDVVPLLEKPATASLKAFILQKTEQRNSGSWGLQAARALGMTEGSALKFKINLFAPGDWPKLRMWFDSTKDPSVGGIWNFNEHVRFALQDPKKTPLQTLDAVLAKLRLEATENDTKWVRYEFSSPVRAPFKITLAAWVAKQLPGVRLTARQ
jgi:hypothetical protein